MHCAKNIKIHSEHTERETAEKNPLPQLTHLLGIF